MNDLGQTGRGELTPPERASLAECEAKIKAGLQTFYEVGGALLTIRDARLYRRDFDTFEAYCRGRWHMGASRARQLIGAAGVYSNLESVTNVTPTNEAQTRELAALTADVQQTVWAFAVACAPVVDDRPHVTASHIRKAAYTVELLKSHGWKGDLQPGRAFLIDAEFHSQMPPVEPWLFDSMESSMLRLGILNPLVVWGNTILDGHVRYFIAMKNGLEFDVTRPPVESRDEAIHLILMTHTLRKSYTAAELYKVYEETGDDELLPFIQAAADREEQESRRA